jgi:hypothetical protein
LTKDKLGSCLKNPEISTEGIPAIAGASPQVREKPYASIL